MIGNVPRQKEHLASAARTTAQTQATPYKNPGYRGVRVITKATALAATPGVTPTIQGYDAITNTYYDLLVGTAIATAAPTVQELVVHPDMAAVTNAVANKALPKYWRINMGVADADSLTYGVSYEYLP